MTGPMKFTRYRLVYKAGQPGRMEGSIYFHIDDQWLDNEWTDGTNKFRQTPHGAYEQLVMKLGISVHHDVSMNTDMVYKILDEFVRADWYCTCID